ncbi:MAG: hypothetical protein R2715_09350 [Ilumatobacteraceae bacterium]
METVISTSEAFAGMPGKPTTVTPIVLFAGMVEVFDITWTAGE